MSIGRAANRAGVRRRVIVVGAGFSGAAAAAQMLARGDVRVTLVGRGGQFGLGLAYGEAGGAHLLNNPAARMSALEEDPDHFVRWLARRGGAAEPARFASRADYGSYVQSVLHKAEQQQRGGALTKMRADAVACRREGSDWVVTLASGRVLRADAVVLALGHPPPAAPAPFAASDLIGAWDQRAQRRLPRRGDVLMLGTGLTMVDVALTLAERKGVLYALSRRGRTPHVHSAAAAAVRAPGEPPLDLSAALHAFRARATEDWRDAIDSLRGVTPELWARLGLTRQQRFLRHLRPWWDVHRHRLAPETGARFAALMATGRVRILAGEIASAARENGIWRLQHRQRGSRARHRIEVAGIINCTGPDYMLARWDDALVRQLLNEGLARAPENGLGFDVDPENCLRDKTGVAQKNLFVLGPLAVGSFWETIAVPELRARAAAIAQALGG